LGIARVENEESEREVKEWGKMITHVLSAFPTSPKISLQRDLIIFRMIFNAKMQEGIFMGR
jgi:hypothetical protein